MHRVPWRTSRTYEEVKDAALEAIRKIPQAEASDLQPKELITSNPPKSRRQQSWPTSTSFIVQRSFPFSRHSSHELTQTAPICARRALAAS